MMQTMKWVEKDIVPDFLLRRGIRNLLKERLREQDRGNIEAQNQALQNFLGELR